MHHPVLAGRSVSLIRAALGLGGLFVALVARADTPVQPGVFVFEAPGSALRISNVRSGTLCASDGETRGICETAAKVVISGRETCRHTDGNDYPCTRFGYAFDYRGAEPGSTIDCAVKRQDPMGRRTTTSYTHELNTASGRVFYPSYRSYGPVERRLIFSEVHSCSYRGDALANVEYIIYYEPGSGPPTDADPQFTEVPLACSAPHLTEDRARALLGAQRVKASAANEHVAVLQSQCIYSARGGTARQTGYVYKFMLSDMFDVDRVDPVQLQFNAIFASGGSELKEMRDGPGDRAFVFLRGERTTLMVITGIRGRDDFAGRRQEFTANYYLDHPGLSHEERTDMLIELAEQDLQSWRNAAP